MPDTEVWRRRVKGLTSLALLTLLVEVPVHAAGIDLKSEQATLLRLDKAWAEAAAAKDLEKILSYWADDAQMYPPGQPAVVGKEALRQYVSSALAIAGFAISWETREFIVASSGDMAYGLGTNVVTFPDAQGNAITERGRAVTVWRKGALGWKCIVDIWNAEPSAPLAPK